LRAFKIHIERYEAVAKLSQDRTAQEQQQIIEGLSKSTQPQAQSIAELMKKWL
jgi:predicted FMN-binding regulatory protein PaiB